MTKLVMENLHKPPLSGQSNNTERLRWLGNEVREWRLRMSPATTQRASEIYQEAIEHSPRDHFVVENFAEFLEAGGDLKQAAAQW
jgi:hypothetical protein